MVRSSSTPIAVALAGLLLGVLLEGAVLFGPPFATKVALALAVAPLAFVVLMRLPAGVVLALAIIGAPIVNYLLVPGNAGGIPPESVALVAFCEFTLLMRGRSRSAEGSLRPVEWAYLAAMTFALILGLLRGGVLQVIASEIVETANLVILVFILRRLKFDRSDLVMFAIAAHLLLLPLILPYLATSFGGRRIDYFYSQLGTLIPISAWIIFNGLLRRRQMPFVVSTLVLVIAAFSTGQRGLLMVAVAGSAVAVGLHLLRASSGRAVGMVIAGGVILTVFLEAMPILKQIAPGPTERLSEGFGALTYQTRVAEAQDALAVWRQSPSGVGLGAAIDVRSDVEFDIMGPRLVYVTSTFIHNSYAWYLAKTGVQGLLALSFLIGQAGLAAFRNWVSSRRLVEAQAALIILVISVGGAIGGPALHGFYYTSWVAMAVVLATSKSESPEMSRVRAAVSASVV
ncbi:MAG: hypothetical protein EPO16_07575 [Dehalococcoidia bacterium]|nr:MAG: hypothetical protein EPO16_07575 [Dehalococcoidia bacterium]